MRFSYFDLPHDITKKRSYSDVIGDLRRTAEICDESGFDIIWLGEHHFSIWGRELTPNPILLASDLAARTKRIRVGLSAAIITFWHPLRLAEDIATLDHLTGGRLEVGVGRGNYGLEAFNLNPDADPNNPQQNFDVFDETLQILKKALGEERFSHRGRFYQFPAPGFNADKAHTVDDPAYVNPETNELIKLTIYPRPLQKPTPPLWTVVNSALSIQHAAENNCGIIMWRQTNKALVQQLKVYKEAYEAAHNATIPTGRRTAIVRDTFVADSLEEARRIAGEAALGALNFSNWRGPYIFLDPGEELAPDLHEELTRELTFDFVNDRALLFGSPDDVVQKLIALHEETGIEQVTFKCSWPGLEFEHTERSLLLLRDEVIPRVNAHFAEKRVAL